MRPSPWYLFYLSLPLEVRVVSIVLFLQALALLSASFQPCTPHLQCQAIFTCCDNVFVDPAVSQNKFDKNSATVVNRPCVSRQYRYIRDDLLCYRATVTPDLSPDLMTNLRDLGIARHRQKKARRSRRGGRNERRKIKVIQSTVPATTAMTPSSVSVFAHSLPRSVSNLTTVPLSSLSASSLVVGLFNARSVGSSKRRSEICVFILDNDVDIMVLTETWLRPAGDEAKIADLGPSGYFVVSVPRPAGGPCVRGGGLAFVVKDSLKLYVTTCSTFPLHHHCFEAAQLTLSFDKQRTNFMCVYRPPPSKKNKFTDSMFFDQFPDFLEHSNNLPGKTILMGDFNFPFDQSENPNTKKLSDVTEMFEYMQSVCEPTHSRGHILDLVFFKPTDCLNLSTCLMHDLETDHTSVLCKLDISKPRPKPTIVHFRSLRKINRQSFKKDISQAVSPNSCSSVTKYNTQLRSILDEHAPLLCRKVSSRKPTPWFNSVADTFRALKRECRRAERKWGKSRLTVHRQIYDSLKQKIADLVDSAKIAYYSLQIQTSTTCKQLFNTLNTILGKTFTSPLPTNIAPDDLPTVFSKYFTDKIRTIRENFPPSSFASDSSVCFSGKTFNSFEPVSEQQISELLKVMSPKSCELDPVPTKLLYENLDVLLPTVTNLINMSLSTGSVPCDLKTAIVRPLLKKPSLDKNLLKNYRPVSNLPFLSKLLEKVVLTQILSHLKLNNLCNPLQSAYRTGHSTETVLVRVVNDILAALDDNKISILLLLDLSSAFDTIDHQILLSRLENDFGIHDTALDWFRSYLSDRKQVVSVNDSCSQSSPLPNGVPQGSVLGPILFVIYTTPLSSVISKHSVSHQLFADDTQLQKSSSLKELPDMTTTLRLCTDDIKHWMTDNQLKLNDDKTEALLFSHCRTDVDLPTSITLGACDIPFSETARNLGFIFDSNLSMRQHVHKVCQIAYLELKRISSIRHLLSESAAKTLVTSYILSRLDYCNCLLMGAPLSVTQPLQKVLNSAARLVLKASRFDSPTSLLFRLHWLPITERIKYKIACICFNVMCGSAPCYLSELLHVYTPSRSLRSASDSRLFKIPRYNRKIHAFRSLSHFGPFLWNSLPFDLRHSPDIPSFKSRLKTYLFTQYFSG